MLESDAGAELRSQLSELSGHCEDYFDRANELLSDARRYTPMYEPDYFWSKSPADLQQEAEALVAALVGLTGRIAAVARQSLLVTEADQRDLSILTKTMRACLMFRNYAHWDTEILHDEGEILGVRRGGQPESESLDPPDARRRFTHSRKRLDGILDLVAASASSPKLADAPVRNVSRIRQDTAFVMMWMDPSQPELDDVCDVIKDVFFAFGVHAIRADDIEHEDIITARILAEIEGSEFLVADLTGARPSVYYEAGYAHALKKRVILYRKKGTQLHFDLAAYNCPEYENLRDLREKLTKRLEAMTNKQPRDASNS